MQKKFAKVSFYSVIVMFVLFIVGAIYYTLNAGGESLPVHGQAANFEATNVNGKKISFQSLNGKIRLVTFFYTHCPGPCPIIAYRLEQVQQAMQKEGKFGSKVAIMSITLDPQHDSLPILQKWALRYHPDEAGWFIVRPTPADLPNILQNWAVQKQVVPGTVYISHTVKTVLIDQSGNIRAVYPGDNPDPVQMEKDIQSLLTRWNWTNI
jgi:protein SCO1